MCAMKPKILVVEDEPDILELIRFNLEKAGFCVISAIDGSDGFRKAREQQPELVVLDLMLPGVDGFEVCKLLRANSSTAGILILMLTAKAAEIDRVLGLELGADDYLTKPFSPRELVLRIRNLLSRNLEGAKPKEVMRIGSITIDIPRHQVLVQDQPIQLTATEFKLLALLAQRCGRVQTRDQLLRDVWEYDATIDTRTVDTHMRRLRDKLGPAATHIDTVRGVGYKLVDPAT
jgi:DNA-binding response OmpR family regulator